MSEIEGARKALRSALKEYARADTEAKRAQVVLSLHGGLDKALRAYLVGHGVFDVDSRSVHYPSLVDLVRDHTPLFADDAELPRLLVSLNNTRRRIAHPEMGRPSADEISRDARQYVNLARRFWPEIFREAFPEALLATPAEHKRASEPVPSPRPTPSPRPAASPRPAPSRRPVPPPDRARPRLPRWPRVKRFLSQLWSDKTGRRLQKRLLLRRVIGVIFFLILSKLCKEAAIFSARWPEPIKYVGILLFILGVALLVWGLILVWKVLRQIRLKGVLLFVAVTYLLLLSVDVLTSAGSLPWYQEAWQTTRDWAGSAAGALTGAIESVVKAPEEFRVAYRGYRRPVQLPGMDAEDPTYLTPIPANRPVRLPAGSEPTVPPGQPAPMVPEDTAAPGQPAGGSSKLPDCPYPLARVTAPLVGQVIEDRIQVKGTANIEGFAYYKFEYRREDGEAADEWHWIASFETPVDGGVLGTWDVSHLPAGVYTFRLTVVDRQGNYPFPPCEVSVQIAHP